MTSSGSPDPAVRLPGAVVDRVWMHIPMGSPGSKSPREWDEGLWGLDAAVQAAIKGGWTDDEIRNEVAQLVKSHRPGEADRG